MGTDGGEIDRAAGEDSSRRDHPARPQPAPQRRTSDPTVAPPWLHLFARPLATNDRRAEFWVRHLRLGVVLTYLTCLLVLGYVIGAGRPHTGTMTAVAITVMCLVSALLLVPMRTWSQDLRGVLLFYVWSLGTITVITAISILDGGGQSPLAWLLVLTLTYAGLAYPPVGVLAMGAVTVAAHLTVSIAGTVHLEDSALQGSTLALLSVMIAWSSRNQWELIDGQQALADRLAVLADTDVLTSCLNRRAFDHQLERAAADASAAVPLSLCMVDLDGFKRVNDDCGHAAGDALLARIADAVRASCRSGDSVARLGGDEFAVLLPSTPAALAHRIGERLRVAVAECGGPLGVTASVGVVTSTRATDGTWLLTRADRLMYGAKRAGGDRTYGRDQLAG